MLETWRGPTVFGEYVQVTNNTASTIVVGTAVIVLGGPTCALVLGQLPQGVAAYSIAVPIGSVSSGSLGVICDVDVAVGDTQMACCIGLVGARSDGSGIFNDPLTIDTSGRLKLATASGVEVIAFAAGAPRAGKIFARLVSPFPLP